MKIDILNKKNKKIVELFKSMLSNKKRFINESSGAKFENQLINKLESLGFTRIHNQKDLKDLIQEREENKSKEAIEEDLKSLKKRVKNKKSTSLIKNPFKKINNNFIHQIYGQQDFPDFLVFLKNYVIPIEVKFSKGPKNGKYDNCRPIWNSNLPKANAIYIYGVSGLDVTFFWGDDILSDEWRNKLIDFFKYRREKVEEFIENNLEKNPNKKNLNSFGLTPYIRIAYGHVARNSTHMNNNDQYNWESYFSKNRRNREKRVIELLNQLTN